MIYRVFWKIFLILIGFWIFLKKEVKLFGIIEKNIWYKNYFKLRKVYRLGIFNGNKNYKRKEVKNKFKLVVII